MPDSPPVPRPVLSWSCRWRCPRLFVSLLSFTEQISHPENNGRVPRWPWEADISNGKSTLNGNPSRSRDKRSVWMERVFLTRLHSEAAAEDSQTDGPAGQKVPLQTEQEWRSPPFIGSLNAKTQSFHNSGIAVALNVGSVLVCIVWPSILPHDLPTKKM